FVPEGPAGEPAPEGYVFEGKVGEDLAQALGRAGELVPATEKALDELRAAAKSFNQFMPELRRMNGEAELAMHNFSKASESVDNLIRGNQDRVMKAIDQMTETARQLTMLFSEENQRQLNATIKNIRKASDGLAEVVTDENRKNMNAIIKNGRSI